MGTKLHLQKWRQFLKSRAMCACEVFQKIIGCVFSLILWGYQQHSNFWASSDRSDMICGCLLDKEALSGLKWGSAPLFLYDESQSPAPRRNCYFMIEVCVAQGLLGFSLCIFTSPQSIWFSVANSNMISSGVIKVLRQNWLLHGRATKGVTVLVGGGLSQQIPNICKNKNKASM